MANATAVDESLFSGSASAPDPKNAGVFAKFYQRSVLNKELSVKEGRPVHELREYVRIMVAGDKTNQLDREATKQDKQRFSHAYQLFRSGDAEQVVGTPLALLPFMNQATVDDLAHFKIRTVEQLAALSDGNLMQVGPIRDMRTKAQDYLAAAKGVAPTTQLRAELDSMQKQNASMARELQELKSLLEKQTQPDGKKK